MYKLLRHHDFKKHLLIKKKTSCNYNFTAQISCISNKMQIELICKAIKPENPPVNWDSGFSTDIAHVRAAFGHERKTCFYLLITKCDLTPSVTLKTFKLTITNSFHFCQRRRPPEGGFTWNVDDLRPDKWSGKRRRCCWLVFHVIMNCGIREEHVQVQPFGSRVDLGTSDGS